MKILLLVTFVVTVLVIYSEQSEPVCTCTCKGPHEVYSECGSACPAICNTPPKPCIQICERGCFCAPGHVRASNKTDSKCIPILQCGYSLLQL